MTEQRTRKDFDMAVEELKMYAIIEYAEFGSQVQIYTMRFNSTGKIIKHICERAFKMLMDRGLLELRTTDYFVKIYMLNPLMEYVRTLDKVR